MTGTLYENTALYSTLKELAIIPVNLLDEALFQSRKENLPLGNVLLDNELITDENLGRIIADILGIRFIRVSQISISAEIRELIPEVVARKNRIITFKKDKNGLHIATTNPHNRQMIEFIEKKEGLPLVVYYSTEKDIALTLGQYSKDVLTAFDEVMHQNIKDVGHGKKIEPPIIKIVDIILQYAYQNKTSDIHLEPQAETTLVRFRIDGILHDIIKLPANLHDKIVTRIKVLSKLRTDEHQAPQDGKLQFTVENEEVDVRVSIVPVTEGEKIVMRLLAAQSRRISLTDLGLFAADLGKLRTSYKKPYGMILATGPTGSGKTTTMYAILKLLNKREVNIMTIEDPVEYGLEGINQIQVNPKTNLTFAEGLRSIVRQDPNVILVGEIRDQETASIAVNAAMTGHLVLSTLHTNDAATAIPRLLDMRIEPFLIASSVNMIIAQRLVRKIHASCRLSREEKAADLLPSLGEPLLKELTAGTTVRLYRGKGCPFCHNTGYEGRIGIFEVLQVDEQIRHAIVDRKNSSDIQKLAIEAGMNTMIRDGLDKVKQGITTIEEVIRVTKE